VACVAGVEQRTDCEPAGHCNRGECAPLAFSLPEDAGPHQERTEWWYYTGHLAAGQAAFGFQVTIFQYDLGGYFGYMCHVAVADETAGAHFHTDGITLSPAAWSARELAVLGCRFELDGTGHDRIFGVIEDGHEKDGHPGTWRIELELAPLKRVVPHGADGIIPMGTGGGTSWYYSYTRLQATGTLTTPRSGPLQVSGQAWMDHQWGDFDITEFQGWDWWSMQLADDSEIMLFTFRDWEGTLVSQAGSLVEPDGTLTAIEGLDAFTIEPQRHWASPHTDGLYPLDWDIRVPAQDWILRVRTPIDDQEMHNIAQSYWEGVTSIAGSRGGLEVRGVGFTELTGYATDWLDP
jgi:predicted secreted hydrolase